MITSLAIGLGGLMSGLLFKGWQYIISRPYTAPFRMLNYTEGVETSRQNFYLLSAVYVVLLLVLSYKDFTKKVS